MTQAAGPEPPWFREVRLDADFLVERRAGSQVVPDDGSAQEPDGSPGQHCDCLDAMLEVQE